VVAVDCRHAVPGTPLWIAAVPACEVAAALVVAELLALAVAPARAV
jgi:hypothetical protein